MPTVYIPRRVERPPLRERVTRAFRERKWLLPLLVGCAAGVCAVGVLAPRGVSQHLLLRQAQAAVSGLPDVPAIRVGPVAEAAISELLSAQVPGHSVLAPFAGCPDAAVAVAWASAEAAMHQPQMRALWDAILSSARGTSLAEFYSDPSTAYYAHELVNYYAPLVRLLKSLSRRDLREAFGERGLAVSRLSAGQKADMLRSFVGSYRNLASLRNVDLDRSSIRFRLDGDVYFRAVPKGGKDPGNVGVWWKHGNSGLPLRASPLRGGGQLGDKSASGQ